MTSSDAAWYLSHNVPTVIQWRVDEKTVYLGSERPQPCRVTADVGYDALQHSAVLRFHLSVWLKQNKRKATLHILVHPDEVYSLEDRASSGANDEVINALKSRTQQCASSQDIFSLRVLLRRSATVIGPSNLTDVSPKTESSRKILNALCSLCFATDFLFHVPANGLLKTHAHAMCEDASRGTLRPSAQEYDLNSLYGGSGGIDLGNLLAQYSGRDQGPPLPSYDELVAPDVGKRALSNASDPPTPKRTQSDDCRLEKRIAAVMGPLEQRLSEMQAELTALRNPTEDASLVDRLDGFQDQLNMFGEQMSRLKTQVDRIDNYVQERQETSSEIVAMVENRLDELQETHEVIDDKVEDRLLGWKVDFEDWFNELPERVDEAIAEHVRAQLEDLLEQASFAVALPGR